MVITFTLQCDEKLYINSSCITVIAFTLQCDEKLYINSSCITVITFTLQCDEKLYINSSCITVITFTLQCDDPIKDWGRISVGLSEHLCSPEIVSRLNQPGVCLNSQVMTMDIGSETASKLPRSLVQVLLCILLVLNVYYMNSIITIILPLSPVNQQWPL